MKEDQELQAYRRQFWEMIYAAACITSMSHEFAAIAADNALIPWDKRWKEGILEAGNETLD